MADLTALVPRIEPTIRDLTLLRVGYMPRKDHWINQGFTLFGLGLVTSGRGSYRMANGPTFPILPGSLFAVFPGPSFHYGPDPDTTWEEYHVLFSGRGVERLIERGWFFTTGRVEQVVGVKELVERMRELRRMAAHSGPGDSDRALLMAERLLLEMYCARESLQAARTPSSAMEAVISHCHRHFADPIDFAALARRHAISYSHLRQQLKRITGLGPAHYLTRLRCE
ncbi:MAG TPA: AraC family ligand binding domain-containing protein, partial [Polyangiaceae bacterium]|nr:AraC family ligand binding domain-containing protein [Polyangiaceae bacterium]